MSKITVYPARKVITMDPGRPVAEAVAVMDGRVLSTGTLESMRPWLSRHEHVIDNTLKDKVVLPGLIDPHTHFAMSSGFLALHYIGPIESPGLHGMNPALLTHAAVVAKLREVHAAEKDPAKPIVAWGLDPALQGGHLHRDELDSIMRDRPIWVISYAPHFVYVNSVALKAIGIGKDTAVHGVQRYPDGRLDGVFVEIEATRLALAGMRDEINKGGGAAGLRRMAEVAHRAGVTATAEMVFGWIDFETEWKMHAEAVNDPAFPMRMALVPLENPLYKSHGARAAEFLLEARSRDSEKLFFHGIKFLSDGSFPAMSLRLNFPGYLDGTNGLRNDVPWDEFAERMLPFWKAGIQIHCHANGDEAIDASLDALAKLQALHPRFDHRFTIEHYCISTPEQARRLKALGGVASVNNYFVHYRSQLHSEQGFGPDRSEAVARLGSLEREGVVFTLHSDFSLVVVPMHPLTAAWVAVNRVALDGKTVMAPGERIGVERAMRAITIDAAYVLGLEKKIGSLEPGKLADFAVLEQDPFEVDPMAIRDIPVWGTVLGGRLQPGLSVPGVDKFAAAAESWQMLSGILQAAQMIPQNLRSADGSLPLTVIGGFLGAGKTTLLNRLLTQSHGRRIAVLVNDFGRINIDAALVRSRTEDMISLANGCACCTVAGDLTRTLIELAQRPEAPEAIVLEASGVADPRGIVQVALANPALRLDGILAVVDAETIAERAADPASGATLLAQIAAADLVILNKLDLADDAVRATARAWLTAHAAGKPVIETEQAQVPADVVLGVGSTQSPSGAALPDHSAAFESWSGDSREQLDSARLRAMLAGLPDGVLRAKGVLWLSEAPDRRTIYQRVGRRSSFSTDDWGIEPRRSGLVVIGPAGSIDTDALTARFDACRL